MAPCIGSLARRRRQGDLPRLATPLAPTEDEPAAEWEEWVALCWKDENQINQVVSLSLSLPSLPLAPAVTPPLSPSVASPPPRRLSLKRFSLFSRFPGKRLHGPKQGRGGRGEVVFFLRAISPSFFFYPFNFLKWHHLLNLLSSKL